MGKFDRQISILNERIRDHEETIQHHDAGIFRMGERLMAHIRAIVPRLKGIAEAYRRRNED